MIQKFLSGKDGSITTEASLVVPVVIFCIFAILYFSINLYHRSYLQSVADTAAERGTDSWDNPAKDIRTGRIGINNLNKAGLYWRIYDIYKSDKIRKIENSIDRRKSDKVIVSVQDYIIYKKINVGITGAYRIPIGGYLNNFGLDSVYRPKVQAVSVVCDPAEFIRNADLVLDIEKELEGKYPGFGEAAGKTRDTLKKVREKIAEFMQ